MSKKEKLYAVKVLPVGDEMHFSEKFPIYVAVNGKEVYIKPNTKVYLTKAQILALEAAIEEQPRVGDRMATMKPRFMVQYLMEDEEEETPPPKAEIEVENLPKKKEKK